MSFLLSIIFNNDYFRYISMLLSEHLFLKVLVFHKTTRFYPKRRTVTIKLDSIYTKKNV